jgi:hypothetical protein
VTQGQSASFTVGATGTPLIYYWRKNGLTISGATNATYLIPSTLGSDAASYSVLVSNFLGSRFSSSASLTVLVPVSITVQPTSRIVGEGSNTTFSVTASGTSPGFQWYKNATAIAGANGSSYSINNVQFSDGADYTVVAANSLNSVTSQVATLTVQRFPPAITDQPVSQSIPVGNNAVFAVGATGTTLVYQWQKNGTNIPAATDAALLLTNVGFADATGYSVILTNPIGSVTSIVATLTVGYPPAMVQQPASLIIPVGSNAVFNADVSGTEPLSYQWSKNQISLLNQTNKVLQLNTVTANDTAAYTLFAYSPFGAVTSAVATLTVQLPPQIIQPPLGGFGAVGSNFYLTVTAAGWDPLSYQWQKDGLAIPSATATNYSRTNLTLADSGAYTVVITNFLGSVTSSVATLTVGYPPVVVAQPQSLTNFAGSTATFSCTVTGSLPMNLQWAFNGSAMVNQTNSTLTLINVQSPNIGSYSLTAVNAFGQTVSAAAELAIPGLWRMTGALTNARTAHTATLLASGKVLVVGGFGNSGPLSSAELFDPATGAWTPAGALATARYLHTATLLTNGLVLVAGGYGGGGALSSAELFDPAMGTWTPAGGLTTVRYQHTATLLPNGKVLVAGGVGGGSYLSSAELFDPATGTWTPAGGLTTVRYQHTATLLPNGKVLVAGGVGGGSYLSSAEVFDPANGTWTPTGPLAAARYLQTATLLPNGKVLVAGGYNGSILSSVELFDPNTGTWTSTGALNTPREAHTATLLPNGKVLVAGGDNGSYLSSAELYDPATTTWTPTGALTTAREYHTATLLAGGRVLIAGGYGGSFLASAELFDSITGTWTVANALASAREEHTATLLPNGLVLIAGGDQGSSIYLSSAELYDSRQVISSAGVTLTGATTLPNGAFRFSFTNSPGLVFQVVATTNLALPLNAWVALGVAAEVSPGQFQFTDQDAPNNPRRFYRVRLP